MARPTKNIITRASITEELLYKIRRSLRFALAFCIVFTVIFVPAGIGIATACVRHLPLRPTVASLIGILVGVVLCSPAWISYIVAIDHAVTRRRLLRGELEISVHSLSYKEERMINRHLYKRLEFPGFDVITVGDTAYDLAALGEEFYIVHRRRKRKILLLYPLKIYEYRENASPTDARRE